MSDKKKDDETGVLAYARRMFEGFRDKSAKANGKPKETAEGVKTQTELRELFGSKPKKDTKKKESGHGDSKKRQADEDEATRSLRNSEWGRYMQKPGGK